MKQMIEEMLTCITTSDYAPTIAELIADDVEQNVKERADKHYSMTDIRLAIGRVLIEKLTNESI